MDHSWTLTLGAAKPAAPLKPPEDTTQAFTPSWEDSDLLIQESPRNPEDSQKHNPGRLTFFTTAAGRSAALDVCVASSNAAAARVDAAQAAFDRKTSHYKRNPRPTSPRHRLSSPCLDSRRPTTPSSHQNLTVRSRHRIVWQRTTNVSKSSPAQMETRNSNSPPPTPGSHDSSSPA